MKYLKAFLFFLSMVIGGIASLAMWDLHGWPGLILTTAVLFALSCISRIEGFIDGANACLKDKP